MRVSALVPALHKIIIVARASVYFSAKDIFAPVAQLDRAPAYGAGGYRFDSCLARV